MRRNREITSSQVQLIGADQKPIGVISLAAAIESAQASGLDLVEVSPARDDKPPVCKIMDYGKFVYQQNKNQDTARKHQHQQQLKEVRFTPRIGEGDYQVKLNSIIKFLNQGDKVKATVRFRGRELSYKDQGIELLNKLEAATQEIAQIEQNAKFEGRQMNMVLAPKKKATTK